MYTAHLVKPAITGITVITGIATLWWGLSSVLLPASASQIARFDDALSAHPVCAKLMASDILSAVRHEVPVTPMELRSARRKFRKCVQINPADPAAPLTQQQ